MTYEGNIIVETRCSHPELGAVRFPNRWAHQFPDEHYVARDLSTSSGTSAKTCHSVLVALTLLGVREFSL